MSASMADAFCEAIECLEHCKYKIKKADNKQYTTAAEGKPITMLAVFAKFHSRNKKTGNRSNIRKPEVRKAGAMRSRTDTAHTAPFFWRIQAGRPYPKNKAERAPPDSFARKLTSEASQAYLHCI